MSWFCANNCGRRFERDDARERVCDVCRADKRTQLVLDLVGIREGECIIPPDLEREIVDGWLIGRGMELIDRMELMDLRAHNKLLLERAERAERAAEEYREKYHALILPGTPLDPFEWEEGNEGEEE